MQSDLWEEVVVATCRSLPRVRGKTRIGWRMMERARRNGHLAGTWKLTLPEGTRLELPRRSRTAWIVAVDGYYDNHLVRALEPYIRPGTAVLDVGASLGLWTVQLANAARRRGAVVHAFEPNPANVSWLRRNVELNELQDIVTIHPIGLGDADAEVAFGATEDGVGNGAVVDSDIASTEFMVALRRLDGLPFEAPVSLIKLDVEGYETAVLRGACGLVARDSPAIFGEFSKQWLQVRGENVEEIVDLIDYQPLRVNSKRSRLWRPDDETAVTALPRPVSPGEEDLLLLASA